MGPHGDHALPSCLFSPLVAFHESWAGTRAHSVRFCRMRGELHGSCRIYAMLGSTLRTMTGLVGPPGFEPGTNRLVNNE